jgi:hypothetical protein
MSLRKNGQKCSTNYFLVKSMHIEVQRVGKKYHEIWATSPYDFEKTAQSKPSPMLKNSPNLVTLTDMPQEEKGSVWLFVLLRVSQRKRFSFFSLFSAS